MNKASALVSRLSLPLLTKELIELASRRRTFMLRVLYALLLFGFAMFMMAEVFYRSTGSAISVMGHGSELLVFTLALQVAGICLFLPMLTCGAIANEKETNTISLLFLTRLSPWTIIFEKLGSRLISMTSCILLSVPLMAFAYALGGVNVQMIVMGVVMLLLSMLMVGSLAIFCSCYFGTMAGAFIACYLIGLLNVLIIPFFCIIAEVYFNIHVPDEIGLLLLPPAIFSLSIFRSMSGATVFTVDFVAHLIAVIFNICLYLGLARYFLVRRAFVKPKRRLMQLFQRLDGVFNVVNDRLAGGVIIVKPSTSLPKENPIYWRENTKRSLGSFRHLIRLLLFLEAPAIVISVYPVLLSSGRAYNDGLFILSVFFLWILTTLIIIVRAASLISMERSHDSLDTLLTTPLDTREIIQQKLRSLYPLMATLLLPYLTLTLFRILTEHGTSIYRFGENVRINGYLYGLMSIVTFVLYMLMVAHLSFYIGMRIRSRTRAIMSSLMTIVGWCVVPVVLTLLYTEVMRIHWDNESAWPVVLLTGPATFVGMLEIRELRELNIPEFISFILNTMLYVLFFLWFRHLSYTTADKHLGRTRDNTWTEEEEAHLKAATT